MKEITIESAVKNIAAVTEFVDEQLELMDCPMKAQMQIDIAIDEIFSNIAYYAYPPKTGPVTVQVSENNEPHGATVVFIDEGTPYDPLSRKDPDVTASADERNAGGLGIFIVKKSMDEMTYRFENGKNILTIVKNF